MIYIRTIAFCMLAGVLLSANTCEDASTEKKNTNVPNASTIGSKESKMTEKATFAAGCFWGVEARFRKVEGVVNTEVGYEGGAVESPSYKDVCTDTTGHAEVVQVEFDPALVKYEKLLDVFWTGHDPTTLNSQGPDFGTQYRSAVFYHSPEQQAAAEASKKAQDASGKFKAPVVTVIVPSATFWKAEEYHQQYLEKRGQDSCSI